jgi:hypothetical protein
MRLTTIQLDMFESIVIIIVTGFTLLYMKYYDAYQDADRHYFDTNRPIYYLMKLCIIVLILTLIANARYLFWLIVRIMFKRSFG